MDFEKKNTIIIANCKFTASYKSRDYLFTISYTESSRLVTCVGEVALGVTNEAITAFETANSQETIKNSAELATKALEQLARHKDVSIRYVINIHFPMVIATIY